MELFHITGYTFLTNEDYMTITGRIQPGQYDYDGFGGMIFNAKFTDKAKPFIISSTLENSNDNIDNIVKVEEISFGNLKNLRKVSDDEYEAKFSLTVSPTQPFATAYNKGIQTNTEVIDLNNADLENLRIKIYRYDKGWQISTDDIDLIKQKLSHSK